VWGNGSYKPRNLEAGAPAMREANPITRFCLATEIPGLEILLGNMDGSREMEEREQVLIGRNVSSLVIDGLCNQARGKNVAVACRLRRPKGAVAYEYVGRLAQTGRKRDGRDAGGNSARLYRPEKSSWWAETRCFSIL